MKIPSIHTDIIPVDRIFLKQRLDLLTAKAWLDQSKHIEAEIVSLSKENNVPSAYTTMVAFESTKEKLQREDNHLEDKSNMDDGQSPLLPKKKVMNLLLSYCMLTELYRNLT
jgi:hypothetical protein